MIALRFAHVYYPALLFILSLSSLASLSFFLAYRDPIFDNVKSLVLQTAANIIFSVLVIGVLFCSLFWPGGRLMILVGTFGTLAAIAWLAVATNKKEFTFTNFYNQLLPIKLIFFALIGIWFLVTPPVERYKQLSRHGEDKEAVRLYELHVNDPQNQAKTKAFEDYVRQRDRLLHPR